MTARVGITFTSATVAHPRRPRRAVALDFLVDTGAIYSVVPSDVLRGLGIAAREREAFGLADGTKRTYPFGEAVFVLGAKRVTSKVVFAPPGATPLRGALTLESLGLMVNPVTRELLPMRLFLAGLATGAAADRQDPARPSCGAAAPIGSRVARKCAALAHASA